jgi:hypothetical protein
MLAPSMAGGTSTLGPIMTFRLPGEPGRTGAPLLVDLNTSLLGRPGGARPSGPVTSRSLVAPWLHFELAHHVVVLV